MAPSFRIWIDIHYSLFELFKGLTITGKHSVTIAIVFPKINNVGNHNLICFNIVNNVNKQFNDLLRSCRVRP